MSLPAKSADLYMLCWCKVGSAVVQDKDIYTVWCIWKLNSRTNTVMVERYTNSKGKIGKRKSKKVVFEAEYTDREQRRRILTMSFKKLTKVQNPEIILNKAVLINNMLKHIQKQIVNESRKKEDEDYESSDGS